MRSVGNLPGSAVQTYIRGRNSVSTGCYVIRDGRESLSERSFLFIQRDDGQREFVSLFCAPFLWSRLANAVRLKSHSEAVQKIAAQPVFRI